MIIRKIDDVGRISIPRDIRRQLNWYGSDEIEIVVNPDDSITCRKHIQDELSFEQFQKKVMEMQIAFQDTMRDSSEVVRAFNDLMTKLQEYKKKEDL